MPIREFVIRERDGVWQVWLDNQLLSRHRAKQEAVAMAEALAHAAEGRGEPSKILINAFDGVTVELPSPPRGRLARSSR